MTTLVENRPVDPSIRFEFPRAPKITAPAITEKIALADAARAESQETASRADALSNEAQFLAIKIQTAMTYRDKLASRLARLEAKGPALAKQKEQCLEFVDRLLCSDECIVDHNRATELNSAVNALAWLPVLEKSLPGIIRDVKAELQEAERQLSNLKGETK